MLALIVQTIKKRKWSIIGYIAASTLLMWMLVAIFPSFAESGQDLAQLFEQYPEELFKAFGVEDMQSILASLEGYVGVENYSIMWPIILIIMVVAYGGSALAGEIEGGTIGILLSQPISRIKLFLGKYIAGITGILIFVLASILSIVPFAILYSVDYSLQNNLTLALLGSGFALALFSITMMFSSFFSERGKVTLLSAGLFMLMYFLNILATLQESLANLKYFSLFHYFDYNSALLRNEIDTKSIAVFLGVSLVCTGIGLFWFNRRDIAAS